MTLSHQVDRRSSALCLPRMRGSAPSGIAISKERPTSVPKNSGAGHPDDREWDTLDRQRASHYVCRTAVTPLPEAIADDGDGPSGAPSAPVILRGDRAADQSRDTQDLEEPPARPDPVDHLGLATLREIEPAGGPRGGAGNEVLVRAHLLPYRIGERRIVVTELDERQLARLLYRQRPQHEGVEDRKDGRVCSNPERQRQQRNRGNDRCRPQGPESVSNVRHDSFDVRRVQFVGNRNGP